MTTYNQRIFGAKPYLFFSIVLLLKSCLAYFVIFGNGFSLTPLITEIPAAWLLFCLIEWFAAKRKLMYYMIVNLLLTAIFFAAIMYYKYYGVIVTYHALEQVNQVTAVSNSVFSLLDPYFLFIFTDIIVLAIYYYSKHRKLRDNSTSLISGPGRSRRSIVAFVFFLSFVICLSNVWPNRASMNELKKASEMGILNYEAYTILKKDEQPPVAVEEITQDRINELKGIVQPANPAYFGAAKGKNLVIIQLESFQNFLINLKIDGQEVTPVLNKLVKENMYFPNFYQNVGQGNTSDAEFVVNTSFYVPPIGASTMIYADKKVPSLPKLLKTQGYDSATFHTNVVEFWNRGELYKAVGFDKYYDRGFFGDEDKIFFGSSDEVLYKKTAGKLEEMQKSGTPFYSHVISMTAHHPFSTPPEKDHIKLPERYQDTFVGDYIRAQSYTDYALGKFIDDLKAKGIWDNSLVVLYGDHLGLPVYSLDKDDKELLHEIYGHEYSYTEMINIPLIVSVPGQQPQVFEQMGGQVDILPTVANLLGVPMGGQIHFGQDLLNQTQNVLPQRYYLPSGTVQNNESLLIPGDGYKDGTQYGLSGRKDASPVTEKQYNNMLKLLNLSDSYLRQQPLHSADGK
ncbi:LTA synthase family protein [Paenibacillus gansuensis]|uniref:LTA synthase family protein n=1 Tax=Paenibacillus gansuensis TaxID=306542 RepID=A0ABW5PGN6_9BACL